MAAVAIYRHLPASHIEVVHEEETLTLRPFRPEDSAVFLATVESSRNSLAAYLPWVSQVRDLESTALHLQRLMLRYWEGTCFDLGLFDENKELLACAGLEITSPNPDCFELSYWVSDDYAGQGFATVAAKTCVLYAFEYLGAIRVQLTHDERNTASERLAKRLEFVYEGTLRNITAIPEEALPPGYEASGKGKLYALIPSDRARLSWYETLRAHTRFVSAAGT